jgi:hypothetical protein
MIRKILVLIFVLLGAACSSREADLRATPEPVRPEPNALSDNGDGRRYIDALAAAFEKSDRIVVTEHSNAYDVFHQLTQPQFPKDYRPIIFSAHELSPRERANFLAAIRSMAARTQDSVTSCTFEPHHTIAFFRDSRQTSAMRICFQCGQVEWDGSTAMQPWSLIPTLGPLITGLGMKQERDWGTLAKAAAK